MPGRVGGCCGRVGESLILTPVPSIPTLQWHCIYAFTPRLAALITSNMCRMSLCPYHSLVTYWRKQEDGKDMRWSYLFISQREAYHTPYLFGYILVVDIFRVIMHSSFIIHLSHRTCYFTVH